MNKKISIIFFGVLMLLSSVWISCKRDKDKDSPAGLSAGFDKKAMLTHMADQIIIPNLQTLGSSVALLEQRLDSFLQNPNQANLTLVQTQWNTAFLDYQHCNAFNFGPGEKNIVGTMAENLAIWPVNQSRVEERINAGNVNFNDFERDTRGFQALDYLLFEPNALSSFQNANAESRKVYTRAVMTHIQQWVIDMNQAWPSYRQTFIDNDGKDAGASVAILYNEFLKSYESIKNFKIGIPAGLRAGQTQVEPLKVESYYSQYSIQHIRENFMAVENIWRGRSRSGIEGPGFDDWLETLEEGKALKTQTENNLQLMRQANEAFQNSESLALLVQNDLPRVQSWYTEYQKFTRFIKSDLSSLIGIAITFSSGDGD
jgi:predicted lipoprotein